MLKKISNIPFAGTAEQEAQLKALMAECKGDRSMLMHVMQQAQAIYGYLPFEVQVMIAEGMDLCPAHRTRWPDRGFPGLT